MQEPMCSMNVSVSACCTSTVLNNSDALHLGYEQSMYCIQILACHRHMVFDLVIDRCGCPCSSIRSHQRGFETI